MPRPAEPAPCARCKRADDVWVATSGPYARLCFFCAEIKANEAVAPARNRPGTPSHARMEAKVERKRRDAERSRRPGERPEQAHARLQQERRRQAVLPPEAADEAQP